MDRNSPAVALARILQRLPLSIFRLFEYPFVYSNSKKFNKKSSPLIVLLALPRSGSTLTYQVLTHSIDSIYLNNLGNLLYQLPFFGARLSMFLCKSYTSDFQSKHGFVKGLCGPAEGRKFWSYWLGSDLADSTQGTLNLSQVETKMRYLKCVFASLANNNRPIVTGYLGHTLQLTQLKNLFPDAVFLRLKRDPLANALSILKAWRDQGEVEWFSVFPNECVAELNSELHRKVASQVYWLNKRLESFDAKNIIEINYETLCSNPQFELDRLSSFCRLLGISLIQRNSPPQHFQVRSNLKSDEADLIKLRLAFTELINAHGELVEFPNLSK